MSPGLGFALGFLFGAVVGLGMVALGCYLLAALAEADPVMERPR